MRKTLVVAALLCTCAGAALAQGTLTQGNQTPAHERHGLMTDADANHDGVVTRQEFDAAHAAMFDGMDANHDGQISRDEHGRMGRHGGPGGRHGGHFMGLERADANHDGNITRDEFLAGPLEHFNHFDANHDGVLQASELPQHRDRAAGGPEGGPPGGPQGGPQDGPGRHGFVNPDTNHDGNISRAEFTAQSGAMFDRLDANHDGRITQDEANAMHHGHHGHHGHPPGADQDAPPR